MGLPLGPTLANIFMCHHEQSWLQNCPSNFKPVHYFRYIDDTCLFFKTKQDSEHFLHYINSMHNSIKFTTEHEQGNSLPFLDVKITRNNNVFHTSVYRKPSFSGLGTSFFSYCCKVFKTNGIQTLLNRAYNICSSPLALRNEIAFLKDFFHSNGFPKQLFQQQTEKFFAKKLDYQQTFQSVDKKPMYFSLPYFGHKSILLSMELTKLVSNYFYHINPKMVQVNNFRIGSFFKFKDALPKNLCSSVVYKYSCPQACGSVYIGSTIRTLHTRVTEHRGVSNRTGMPLRCPSQSSPRAHSEQCSGDVVPGDFTIIGGNKNLTDLRILESLYILKLKPNLNETMSAFPLKILN